ncbi:MAG: peptide chain release factor N(5)-glutamine methyltransferase [Aquificae bacterium]|nr:peptide chain release factor N(5)-glutamine methyltransferase [Aquificota bacterium]
METVKGAFERCKKTLKRCGIETYERDCLFLVAHLQGVDPSLLPLEEEKTFRNPERLEKLLKKRCKERVPVAHLIGEWDCLGRTFKLRPRVLAPRAATELLVETVLNLIQERFGKRPLRGLEVGTGSGCIAVNLLAELPRLEMVGIELDPVAYENTLENARLHGVADRLELLKGDAFELLPHLEREGFDFVVSNPPYVAEEDRKNLPPEVLYENPLALFGGPGGTKFHEFFARACKPLLKRGGFLAVEFEPFQKKRLLEVFEREGWNAEVVEDFLGHPRVLIAFPKREKLK